MYGGTHRPLCPPPRSRERLENCRRHLDRRWLSSRQSRLRRGLRRRARHFCRKTRPMIDVYFTPTPNGHKVSIMLEEIGLPHRLLKMDMLAGDHLTPEYRRINTNGRLPAIVHHDPIGGGAPLPIL